MNKEGGEENLKGEKKEGREESRMRRKKEKKFLRVYKRTNGSTKGRTGGLLRPK